MINAHILFQSITGNPDRLLGLVVDGATLTELQTDSDAMPPGGYLKACAAVEGTDGAFYVLGDPKLTSAVPEFELAEFETLEAARASAVEALPADVKASLGLAGFKSHAQLKAERAADTVKP